MKKYIFLILACLILSFLLFGCGGNKSEKTSSSKEVAALKNDIINKYKKDGCEIIEGSTVYSPDKSVSVTLPESYVIVTMDDKCILGKQYQCIHAKNKDGISILFAPVNENSVPYNAESSFIRQKRELIKKNSTNSTESIDLQEINNKWFLVTHVKSKNHLLFASSNNNTEVTIAAPVILKDDLNKTASDIKFH